MAKMGSVVVGLVAVFLGLALGYVGITMMMQAGAFATGESSQSSGILGIGGESSQSASVPTSPWIGLLLALVGVGALFFGLRALFVTSEGRGEV